MKVPADLVKSVLSVVGLDIPSSFEEEKTKAGVRYSVCIEVTTNQILQIANRCPLFEISFRPILQNRDKVALFEDVVLLAFKYPQKEILFRLEFEYFIFNGHNSLIGAFELSIDPEEISIPLEEMTLDITKVLQKYEEDGNLHLDEERGRWYVHCKHTES